MKRLDITIDDVIDVYSGPVGMLWELLMGEEIHVGGWEDTEILADHAGVSGKTRLLDVCCALGGPARHLVKRFGCQVMGLDATPNMISEAIRRTDEHGLSSQIQYRLGNALDMPFKSGTFNMVWGQDAWCYVTDKERLLKEAHRVLQPGGIIAFTDWIQTGSMAKNVWEDLHRFMVFPYMETFDRYVALLETTGFEFITGENLSPQFARNCQYYHDMLTSRLKEPVCERFGIHLFESAEKGLSLWVRASRDGLVGRGRWIARKCSKA